MRLDKLLVQQGLALSRERAKNLIIEGKVWVDGRQVIKPNLNVDEGVNIEVRGEDICPWVSRGGLKLQKAIETWEVPVGGKICLDVGACTGGFTEVLLASGAKIVYALDVGHSQLAEKLAKDGRVVNIEGVNFRTVEPSLFAEPIELIVIDVSFISLEHILPRAVELLAPGGEVIALIKPHFEVGRQNIRKGFVKDPGLHDMVIEKIRRLAGKVGLKELGLTTAPEDEKRNKEFLIYLKK